jgi:hypothetical protein
VDFNAVVEKNHVRRWFGHHLAIWPFGGAKETPSGVSQRAVI